MNGCAVSILYFCVILPGTMVADVFLGGNGIFSVLGIVVAFVLYATRTPSPESPPAPPASDDLTSLRQLVFDLQQQVQALRGELRQLQAKVAHQPRVVNTMPLRLEETPQAVSTEMPKHFPPPASAAAQACPTAQTPPHSRSCRRQHFRRRTPTAAASASRTAATRRRR